MGPKEKNSNSQAQLKLSRMTQAQRFLRPRAFWDLLKCDRHWFSELAEEWPLWVWPKKTDQVTKFCQTRSRKRKSSFVRKQKFRTDSFESIFLFKVRIEIVIWLWDLGKRINYLVSVSDQMLRPQGHARDQLGLTKSKPTFDENFATPKTKRV